MATSTPQSYHLPDLLNTISSLSLRTNLHCRAASEASLRRVFLHSESSLSSQETKFLLSNQPKLGLLMALCFPTCDWPQLTLLCEAGVWCLIAGMRMAGSSSRSLWKSGQDKNLAELDLLAILRCHNLFQHLADDSHLIWLTSLFRDDQERKIARLKSSLLAYHTHTSKQLPVDVSLETYISTRREIHGASVLFDLAELLELFDFPDSLRGDQRKKLERMRELAFDFVAWSIDVASYHISTTSASNDHNHNLVAILKSSKNLSTQGAIDLAGSMIKSAFVEFREIESGLLLFGRRPTKAPSSPFGWFSFTSPSSPSSVTPPSNETSTSDSQETLQQLERYVLALKDVVAGLTHWLYETELFFGSKGADVRAFGWVFWGPGVGYGGYGGVGSGSELGNV